MSFVFVHSVVCFVYSDVLEEITAFITSEVEFLQADAEVMGWKKMYCLHRKVTAKLPV
jgi:hypothetical protein